MSQPPYPPQGYPPQQPQQPQGYPPQQYQPNYPPTNQQPQYAQPAPQQYQPQQVPQGYPPQQMPGVPPVPPVQPMPGQLDPWAGGVINAPNGGGITIEPEEFNWGKWRDEADQTLQPLPDAKYPMEVISSEATHSSNGKPMFKVLFRVISGLSQGRQVFRNFTMTEKQSSMSITFRQLEALGFEKAYWYTHPKMPDIAAKMVGMRGLCHVKVDQYRGLPKNEIDSIEPIGGQVPQQYAQPQQYPPPGQQYMTSSPTQPQPPQDHQQPVPSAPPMPDTQPQQYPFQPPQDQQRPGNVMVDWPPESAPPQQPTALTAAVAQEQPPAPTPEQIQAYWASQQGQQAPQQPPQQPQQAASMPQPPPVPGQPQQPVQAQLPMQQPPPQQPMQQPNQQPMQQPMQQPPQPPNRPLPPSQEF